MTLRLTLIVLLACATTSKAETPNAYQLDAKAAEAYATAYANRDVAAFSAWLADDVVFVDPSNRFEGKQAVVDGLSQTFKRITGTGPDARPLATFRSGNDFIFTAFADFNMLLPVNDLPEREFRFKVNFAMVITVSDAKVVKHTDYVDTEAFVAQMQEQIRAYAQNP